MIWMHSEAEDDKSYLDDNKPGNLAIIDDASTIYDVMAVLG